VCGGVNQLALKKAKAHNRRHHTFHAPPEAVMAWTEQISARTWRVRYRTGDGHTASISGFPTKLAADACVVRLNHDGHTNRPTMGPAKVTFDEWVATWFTALDLDPRTIDNYRSMLRCHILLRWSAIPLTAITTLSINTWIIDLRQLGYANTTIASIIKLLSMILTDAADEGLIPTNPIHSRRRRGRRSHSIPPEKVWATPTEVLRIANQATALGGQTAGLLIITAAWTGCATAVNQQDSQRRMAGKDVAEYELRCGYRGFDRVAQQI
jgi:hypothetical protein